MIVDIKVHANCWWAVSRFVLDLRAFGNCLKMFKIRFNPSDFSRMKVQPLAASDSYVWAFFNARPAGGHYLARATHGPQCPPRAPRPPTKWNDREFGLPKYTGDSFESSRLTLYC